VASKLSLFLAELKRRKVYHVGAAYVVVGFSVVVGAQVVLVESLGLDHLAAQVVSALIVLGFPVALVLAWAYEIRRRSLWRVLGICLVVNWAVLRVVSGMAWGGIQEISDIPGWLRLSDILQPVVLIVGLSLLLTTARSFDAVHVMSPRHVALFKGFATLIVVAAVVQSLLFGFPSIRGTPSDDLRDFVYILCFLFLGTAAIACVISLALTWRVAEQPEARALALFMALLALYWGPLLHTLYVDSDRWGFALGGNTVLGKISLAALVLSVAAFVRFSTLFPRRLTETDLQSSRFPRSLRAIRVKLLSPAIVWGVGTGAAIHMLGPLLWPRRAQVSDGGAVGWSDLGPSVLLGMAALGILYIGLPLLGMTAGALNLRTGYASSNEAERKKILWVVVGCVIGTCLILGAVAGLVVVDSGVPVLEWVSIFLWLWPFSPLVLVLCLAMAVFYRGAIHPALVIRRATVYGMLGVLLVVGFSAAESLLSEVVEEALGLSNTVGAVMTGVLITVLLIPLRGPLSRWAGRWLPDADGEAPTPDQDEPAARSALS